MKKRIESENRQFTAYEIMEGKRYHSALMPSEGEPFEAFERIRHEEGNPRLSLVEIRNGCRSEVVGPDNSLPQVEDLEIPEWDEESDDA